MGQIVKNYIYNSAYQLLAIIIPIITAPYLSHVLGPDNLGIEGYVSSVCQIFTTVGMIGLTSYSTREIAYVRNDAYRRSKAFWELNLVRCMVFAMTLVVYFLVIWDSPYRIYYLVQIVWLFSNFFDVSWLFSGMEIFRITVIRNVIIRFATVIFIFVFVKDRGDLYIYISLWALSQLIGTLSILPQVRKYIQYVPLSELEIKRHFLPSIRVFLPQLATMLYLQVDKVMIENLTNDTKQVAFYNQAEKLIKAPLALITAASTVMMPRIANVFVNKDIEKIRDYLKNCLEFLMLMSFPVAFGIAGLAKQLIPWYLGQDFLPVATAMMMLAPIIVAIAASSLSADQYFIATNQTRILAVSYTASAILNLIINFLLIPERGFIGAAIGTVVSEYFVFAVQYYVLNKQIHIMHTFIRCLKYGVFACVMYIAITFLGNDLGSDWRTTVIQIAVGAGTYIGLLLISKDRFCYKYARRFWKALKK